MGEADVSRRSFLKASAWPGCPLGRWAHSDLRASRLPMTRQLVRHQAMRAMCTDSLPATQT